MKRTAIALAIAAAGSTFSTATLAQQSTPDQAPQGAGQAQTPPSSEQQGAGVQSPAPSVTQESPDREVAMKFMEADKNSDGSLSQDEVKNIGELDQEAFQQADADGNGALTLPEFRTAMQGGGTEPGTDAPKTAAGEADQSQLAGQPETQIDVKEKPAQVQVEQEPPQVVVEQDQPKVTVKQPEPEIQVSQPKPEVEIQQAEPEVTVQQQGQPQVEVEQSEQAQVEVQQPEQGQEPATQAQQQTTIETESAGAGSLMSMQVGDLEGRKVVNSQGKEIGKIDKIVMGTQDSALYGIMSVGGFWGIGDKDVALPIDEMQVQGEDILLTTERSEDELKQAADSYQEDNYRELEGEQSLAEASGTQGGAAGGATEQASFQELDQNQDGAISQEEAQQNQRLVENWDQVDQNRDQQVDQGEFSAFEAQQPTGTQPQEPAATQPEQAPQPQQ